MNVGTLLHGWFEVSGGHSLHRVHDGGFAKIRTMCGLGVRAVFACSDPRHRRCGECARIDRKRPQTRATAPESKGTE